MTKVHSFSIFLLRVVMGWMFFWAGYTKIIDPNFSAASYIQSAKTFTGFYHWLLTSNVLPIVNFLNEWGLTLLGVSLIIGLGVRLSSWLGIILMALYYAVLGFPYPNPHSYIVDEHIIYIAALLLLIAFNAGREIGLAKFFPALSRKIG